MLCNKGLQKENTAKLRTRVRTWCWGKSSSAIFLSCWWWSFFFLPVSHAIP